ncbi:hypothetical protein BLA29_015337, partial [Euroglyphus maynei]
KTIKSNEKITSISVSEQVERKELLPNNFVPKIGFTVNDPASETLHDGDASLNTSDSNDIN